MRILHVNKYLYRRGGAEGYMLDLAQLQRQNGDQVEFFGMQHPDNDGPHRFASSFPSRVELEPPPRGRGGLQAAGRIVWSSSGQRGMHAVMREFRPDVVHCHNIYHQLSPSVLQPIRAAGVPCVMTLHDYKLACPSYLMLDHGSPCDACVTGGPLQAARHRCKGGSLGQSSLLALESWLHRASRAYAPVDVFVCPSAFLAGVMARAGVFPERMTVVNNFVDADPAPTPGSSGEGLVFAGRLSNEKGVDVLIRALDLMQQQTHLRIAGEGPARNQLETLARQGASAGRISFLGRLAKPELQQIVCGSAASVVPSRCHENQPMTVLESFASGVPVIASDLGGLPELIRDGIDGFTVPAEDPPALARALDRVVADPATAHRMGASARQRAIDQFSPAAHLSRLSDVYDRAYEHAAQSQAR